MNNLIQSLIGRIRPYNGVKTPVILQLSETECGIVALAIVFSYYQLNIPLEILREKCGTSRDGCKAVTLMRVAQEYGFEVEAFKIEIDALAALEEPAIAFWNFNHYIVINGIGMKRVFINDPAHGPTAISLEEFDKSFTGVIIVLSPTSAVKKIKTKPIISTLLYEWLFVFKIEFVFMLLSLFILLISPLINSILSNVFIDQCLTSNNIDWIPYIALFSIASTFILTGSTLVQKWNQFKLFSKASLLKSSHVILHALQLSLLFYSLRQKTEIIANLVKVELVVNLLFKSICSFTMGLLTALMCYFFMIHIDRYLALASLIIVLISASTTFMISKISLSYEKSHINTLGKLYSHSISTIRNIETLKACGLEEKTLQKWVALCCQKLILQDKSLTAISILNTLNKFYHSITILSLLWIGGYRVSGGFISVGNLMAYYALHLFFYHTLHTLSQAAKDSQSAYISHIRINDIMTHKKDNRFTQIGPQNKQPLNNSYILSCQKVYFYYNKTTGAALKNINCDFKAGEHIALVGSTGSGKSTLAKLLCALYSVHEGKLLLFGQDISTFDPVELSNYFAYVPQEVSLFAGTIYDNLTLWKNTIPLEIIKNAIHTACLDNLIDDRGLYAKVEECGRNFSEGEKQRIEIARSLIQDTPILILDEATSALDHFTEKKLIQNLRDKNKTLIFAAHRLSTIQHCNQILVMDQGKIVESGTHETLLKNKGLYLELIQSEQKLLRYYH